METSLNEIVGPKAVLLLRDIYVYNVCTPGNCEVRGLIQYEVDLIIEKVSRHLVYVSRLNNYNVSTARILFDEKELEKWVWQEFLQEQIDQDKTTGDISNELNIPLERVNSYLI